MKKFISLAAALLLASSALCNSADAAIAFGFAPNGGGVADPDYIPDAGSFDWAPDNALAVGGNRAVANFIANGGVEGAPDGPGALSTRFTTFAQSRMSALVDINNNNVTPPDVTNLLDEYTVVLKAVERVTGVLGAPGVGVAVFDLVAGSDSFIEIYHDTNNHNVLAGTGYTDGTRILAANISVLTSSFLSSGAGGNLDQFGSDDYPANDTIRGTGSVQITSEIDFIDEDYFPTLSLGGLLKFFLNFNNNLNLPFAQADPAAAFPVGAVGTFVGAGGTPVLAGAGLGANTVSPYGIGPLNGGPIGAGGGESVQEQHDGTASLEVAAVVPEPLSVLAWAGMFAAIGAFGLRRKQRAAK